MLLEVIAKDIKDIEIINNSNANRIEFCCNLEEGGLTPKLSDVILACSKSILPINVMVRPTSRDFYYNEQEKKIMIKQIKEFSKTSINGIVIGALDKNNNIDVDFLKKVIKVKKNLQITFHKAFDWVNDFVKAYKILNDLKIDNVLTSGGPILRKGKNILQILVNLNLNTKILIGGGINQNNFLEFKKISNNIHVGTCVRDNNSWSCSVNCLKINQLLEK